MLMHPLITSQLAAEKRRDMLAQAEQYRLARQARELRQAERRAQRAERQAQRPEHQLRWPARLVLRLRAAL